MSEWNKFVNENNGFIKKYILIHFTNSDTHNSLGSHLLHFVQGQKHGDSLAW